MRIISLLAVAFAASGLSPPPTDAVSALNHPQVQFCAAGFGTKSCNQTPTAVWVMCILAPQYTKHLKLVELLGSQ